MIKHFMGCTGCGACSQLCPTHCIRMEPDKEGFLFPYVDVSACVHCDRCERVCPVLSPDTALKAPVLSATICQAKDETVLKQSSSGGVFDVLARQTLAAGGCVFGAAFDENWNVRHMGIEHTAQLPLLRGSKYVQSEASGCYPQVKEKLQQGRPVLFVGTPCQTAGLCACLDDRNDPNLLLVDLICHGVASPDFWQYYLKQSGKHPVFVSFRDKTHGWKQFGVHIVWDDKEQQVETAGENLFFGAFLRNFCLRESCYQCPFRGENRVADITLADAWDQPETDEMKPDEGLSLVIVHTAKAATILNAELPLYRANANFSSAIESNPAYFTDCRRPLGRINFLKDMHKMSLESLAQKYYRLNFWGRCEQLARRILRR